MQQNEVYSLTPFVCNFNIKISYTTFYAYKTDGEKLANCSIGVPNVMIIYSIFRHAAICSHWLEPDGPRSS